MKTEPRQARTRTVSLDASVDARSVATGSRMAAAALALFLGAFFLYGVGFSPMAHEMAHDTRHAIGFPCH